MSHEEHNHDPIKQQQTAAISFVYGVFFDTIPQENADTFIGIYDTMKLFNENFDSQFAKATRLRFEEITINDVRYGYALVCDHNANDMLRIQNGGIFKIPTIDASLPFTRPGTRQMYQRPPVTIDEVFQCLDRLVDAANLSPEDVNTLKEMIKDAPLEQRLLSLPPSRPEPDMEPEHESFDM